MSDRIINVKANCESAEHRRPLAFRASSSELCLQTLLFDGNLVHSSRLLLYHTISRFMKIEKHSTKCRCLLAYHLVGGCNSWLPSAVCLNAMLRRYLRSVMSLANNCKPKALREIILIIIWFMQIKILGYSTISKAVGFATKRIKFSARPPFDWLGTISTDSRNRMRTTEPFNLNYSCVQAVVSDTIHLKHLRKRLASDCPNTKSAQCRAISSIWYHIWTCSSRQELRPTGWDCQLLT